MGWGGGPISIKALKPDKLQLVYAPASLILTNYNSPLIYNSGVSSNKKTTRSYRMRKEKKL
tara:strand:+ start:332 stop:514 length:183 start_codon:yes stop_codon:yes gene_type:complete